MGFNIMDLKRGKTETAKGLGCAAPNLLKYIDVDDLVPSEDNFYSMSAIEELAGLIELSGGVKQPGLVTPLGGGKYRVIAGHRRRLASIRLVSADSCKVDSSASCRASASLRILENKNIRTE